MARSYLPLKRNEVWRFVSYIFLHADNQHMITDAAFALFVGKYNALKL